MAAMARARRWRSQIDRQEDTTSMLRPTVGEAPIGVPQAARAGRADRAMEVLQYGTAILVLIVGTLLGALR
jgi:hypothetical protein